MKDKIIEELNKIEIPNCTELNTNTVILGKEYSKGSIVIVDEHGLRLLEVDGFTRRLATLFSLGVYDEEGSLRIGDFSDEEFATRKLELAVILYEELVAKGITISNNPLCWIYDKERFSEEEIEGNYNKLKAGLEERLR